MELSSQRLPSGAEIKHYDVMGSRSLWIVGSQEAPYFGSTILPLSDTDALVRALAPEVIAALHRSLPIVAALCGALAETCDEEAASTMALLIDLTDRFPAEAPA